MTATTSTPTPTPTPTVPPVESDQQPVQKAPRRRLRLMGLAAAAAIAAGGATVWITTSGDSGGDATSPVVETVDQGQQYGSADAAERQSSSPAGQQYGSADAAERQTNPEPSVPFGADPRVFP